MHPIWYDLLMFDCRSILLTEFVLYACGQNHAKENNHSHRRTAQRMNVLLMSFKHVNPMRDIFLGIFRLNSKDWNNQPSP